MMEWWDSLRKKGGKGIYSRYLGTQYARQPSLRDSRAGRREPWNIHQGVPPDTTQNPDERCEEHHLPLGLSTGLLRRKETRQPAAATFSKLNANKRSFPKEILEGCRCLFPIRKKVYRWRVPRCYHCGQTQMVSCSEIYRSPPEATDCTPYLKGSLKKVILNSFCLFVFLVFLLQIPLWCLQ